MTPHNDQAVREALAFAAEHEQTLSTVIQESEGAFGPSRIDNALLVLAAEVRRLSPPEGVSEYDRAIEALAVVVGYTHPEARYLAQDDRGLIHYSTTKPTVDPDGFLNMQDGGVWSLDAFPLCPEGTRAPSLRDIRSGKVVRGEDAR